MSRRRRSRSLYLITCEARTHQVRLTPDGEVSFVDHPQVYVELKRKLAWNALCPKPEEHESLCGCEELAAYVLGALGRAGVGRQPWPGDDSRLFRAALRGIRAARQVRKREATV